MKKHLDLLYFLVKIVRFILQVPLIIINFVGNFYANLLLFIDRKNHNANWQQMLQESIDKFKSEKVIISENPKRIIQFYTPSLLASFRAKTVLTKEPDTIKWLNDHESKDKYLFDIGANLGVYSIYYAKKFNAKVFAFEPSFKNLEIMARNIRLNSLQENITIISNPITEKFTISNFFQGDFKAGAAEASFDNKKFVEDFKSINRENVSKEKISYNTLGISIDSLFDLDLLKSPKLIKIDVDGNEVKILKGCNKFLDNSEKTSILIETRSNTKKSVEEKLINHGYKKISSYKDNSIWEN